MKKLIIMFLFLIVLFGCKNNQKSNENQNNRLDVDQSVEHNEKERLSQVDGNGQLDSGLSDLIREYSNEFPIKKTGGEKYVQQSYYVSFFIGTNDTLLAICRQPFLMKIFPDFAFEKEEIPKEKPAYIGMVEDVDLPIFIFDTGGVGNGFYKNASIVKEYSEKYDTGEDKSHTPEIPPIFKYKLQEGKFKFLSKSKSQWID